MFRKCGTLAAVLAVLGLGGCGARGETIPGAAPELRTILTVENDNFSDMRIYVHRGGQRIRLGIANGTSTSTFKLTRGIALGITSLRFEAVPIGGRYPGISEEISVHEGDEITLRIPPR